MARPKDMSRKNSKSMSRKNSKGMSRKNSKRMSRKRSKSMSRRNPKEMKKAKGYFDSIKALIGIKKVNTPSPSPSTPPSKGPLTRLQAKMRNNEQRRQIQHAQTGMDNSTSRYTKKEKTAIFGRR